MSALALDGGAPVRRRPFPEPPGIGAEEEAAVGEVLRSGVLSRFLASWGPDFLGGPSVQALERAWEDAFGIEHAVSMNSATSALYAALGAVGAGPGDEVIVAPTTMCASATCALVWGATPVFADIDPHTLCLDPASVRRCLTPRTKAIVAVHLLGCPADLTALAALAREHGVALIEDAAQAPGGADDGRLCGTVGDVGVFSLNYHKTIQSGEGGVAVTRDPALAERMQLIRNHAEVVVGGMDADPALAGLLGFNFRMTEIEAAIARVQLGRLEARTAPRVELAEHLTRRLAGLPGLSLPHPPPGGRHVYYLYGLRFDEAAAGMSRDAFASALRAEGIPVATGYVRPVYLEPIYQQRAGLCAFNCPRYGGTVSYAPGICPVAEQVHADIVTHALCHAGCTLADMDDVADAIEKVLGAA